MGSSFKRKQYGKVRPVPKVKEKVPLKPSVNDLKQIFRNIQTSPGFQTVDYLSEALLWWDKSVAYCHFRYKKMFPLDAAKALTIAYDFIKKGHAAKTNEEKTKMFIQALQKFQRFAVGVLKTPDISPYLKKSKEVTKKIKDANKKVALKFDPVLSLLTKCFISTTIELVAVAEIKDKATGMQLDRKFDHALGRMFYSRSKCIALKKQLYSKGLLSVVIDEGLWLARGMSFIEARNGSFISDPTEMVLKYQNLLNDFAWFASTTAAPKSLVRREKKKVTKKKVKTSPEGEAESVLDNFDNDGEE